MKKSGVEDTMENISRTDLALERKEDVKEEAL